MNRKIRVFLLLVVAAASARAAEPSMPLAGEWRFSLDRIGVGLEQRWFARELPDRIHLPGTLQSQGYGDPVSTATPWILSGYDRFWYLREEYKAYTEPGRTKVPFLSQPLRHYLGAAWYQREIEVPQSWQGRRIVLALERPHSETTVWLDDRKMGTDSSLLAPHVYDFGQLAPGRYRLTIRIDNQLLPPYHPNAHGVSDSVGGSWNGIVGRIELASTSPVWIDGARVSPDVARRVAVIDVRIGNATGRAGKGVMSAGSVKTPAAWDAKGGRVRIEVPLGRNAALWDEFDPNLHRLTLVLSGNNAGDGAEDTREVVFGLRDFRASGDRFSINGRPVHLRGTIHSGDFPLTGYPPTGVESWRRIMRTARAWGFNHLRFHSFCPPEAAFIAADELGVYLQIDVGMWSSIQPRTPMEVRLYEETERIIETYGNHPSFVLFSPGDDASRGSREVFTVWAGHFRSADPRRVYTPGAGWSVGHPPGAVENADYLAVHQIGAQATSGPGLWFGSDHERVIKSVGVPVVAPEVGQWAAYPDFDVMSKFTGFLRPGNYEIFRDSMAAKGLLEKNRDFARASGRYQLACYKEEIEANLRTPGFGGFQLQNLRDYLGQGSAFVGLLDAFGESKGYTTPEEFRRFCGPTVPLVKMPEPISAGSGRLMVDAEIAHYGAASLQNVVVYWRVVDSRGRIIDQGAWPALTIEVGGNRKLGGFGIDLSRLAAPAEYRLIVGIEGTGVENDWSFRVHPSRFYDATPANVTITDSWEDAEAQLSEGGRVLYVPRRTDLNWSSPPLDVIPIRWNRLRTPGWSRTLGLWRDAAHPALSGFPTAEHFDRQWTDLVRGARAVNLDRLPRALQPIVQAIDDWNRNYKLGVIFECRVGSGRLMVSAVDLESLRGLSPTARLLRNSLLNYMAGPRFEPPTAVSVDQLRGLLFDTRIMHCLGAVAKANLPEAAATTVRGPDKAIDGDPNTYWSTGDPRRRHPHALTVAFPAPVAMAGLVLMPRQDHAEHAGDIREYGIETSDDGREWREVKTGALKSSREPQEVVFDGVITARHLRLTAASGFGEDGTAALAELSVIYAGPKLADSIAHLVSPRPVGATIVNDGGGRLETGTGLRGPSMKFDFGIGSSAAQGFRQVLPIMIYGQGQGYGFEPGTEAIGIDRDGGDAVRGDFITGGRPLFFSVALPEGNYEVTVTLGDVNGESETTVRAELRRLMLERIRTESGQVVTKTFTVNLRRPQISTGGQVRLKERERTTEAWAWDEKLTLEFSGERPAICAVEIAPTSAPTVYLLGDSTVADQPREPYASWGQMLTRFFQPGVVVANHSESGESVHSAYTGRRVDKVLSTIRRGDYLFIQFGHNDQKDMRPGIDSLSVYRDGLYRLVQEVQRREAIPVLVTPMHRRTFDERGQIFNSLGDYPNAVRSMARARGAALIDLHEMSRQLYESLGPEGSGVLFVGGDATHHSSEGAYRLAQLVVAGIRSSRLDLARHLIAE